MTEPLPPADARAILMRTCYLVREHAAPLQPAFAFDILDEKQGTLLLTCREEAHLGWLTRIARFSNCRRTTPFDIRVRTPDGAPVVRLTRGVPVTASRVRVLDAQDTLIGTLHQRAFSLGGFFDIMDAADSPVCRLRGRMTRTEFSLLTPEQVELASIRKRWAGLGRELFTSADDYLVAIADITPEDVLLRQLILAAAVAIGLIVKFELP